MIKKLLVYLTSDGLIPTINYLINAFTGVIYRNSVTDFLYLNNEELVQKGLSLDKTIEIREVFEYELDMIIFPRLKMLDYNKWFSNKSRLIIAFHRDIPIAYGWVHRTEYKIHGLGTIQLGFNQVWMGPYFVDKRYRGRGIQKMLLVKQMSDSNYEQFVTSVNSKNIASLKSFKRLKFKCCGSVLSKKGLFNKCVNIISEDLQQKQIIKLV